MIREWLSQLGDLLRRRREDLRLVPSDARVDPDQFPEHDFPVHCPECGYLLRALPEPRCPECGRPFDRGRLLVEKYVGGNGVPPHRKKGAFWWGWIGVWLVVIASLVSNLDPLFDWLGFPSGSSLRDMIDRLVYFASLAGLLLLLSAYWFERRKHRQLRTRQKQVLEAVKLSTGWEPEQV